MKRAVAYIRVSREDENPENQLFAIMKWAREHGYEVVPFMDYAVSGAVDPFQRPGFKMMLQYMKENGVRTIIVAELERLTRDVEHYERLKDLKRILGWAIEEDIQIISIADYKFTEIIGKVRESLARLREQMGGNPMFKPFFRFIEEIVLMFAELLPEARIAAAQFERERASERTSRALQRLKAEGRVYTKPTFIHWLALYRSGKASLRELTPEEIREAEEYFRERYVKPYLEGIPVRRLHRQFLQHERPVIEFIRKYREADIEERRKRGLPVPTKRVETYSSYTAFYNLVRRLARKQ